MVLRAHLNQRSVGAGNYGISTSPIFASLAADALASLESELWYVRLKSGETLFAAGEPGDSLYVVVFGRLRALIRNTPRGDQVLGEIGRGEAVGEMALLTGEPRSATVYAIRDTALVKLSKAAFDRVIERHPQVMLEMTRLIVARYQRIIDPSSHTQPVSLAVVPCDAGVPMADFSAGLVRALSPGRNVLSVDSERLQRERAAPADGLTLDVESPWISCRLAA